MCRCAFPSARMCAKRGSAHSARHVQLAAAVKGTGSEPGVVRSLVLTAGAGG